MGQLAELCVQVIRNQEPTMRRTSHGKDCDVKREVGHGLEALSWLMYFGRKSR